MVKSKDNSYSRRKMAICHKKGFSQETRRQQVHAPTGSWRWEPQRCSCCHWSPKLFSISGLQWHHILGPKAPSFWTSHQSPHQGIFKRPRFNHKVLFVSLGEHHSLHSCTATAGFRTPTQSPSLLLLHMCDANEYHLHHQVTMLTLPKSVALCFLKQKENVFSFTTFTPSQGMWGALFTPKNPWAMPIWAPPPKRSSWQVRRYRADNRQIFESTNWRLNDWQTASPHEKLCYSNTIVMGAKSMSILDL